MNCEKLALKGIDLNKLIHEKSPYLKHASYQKVDWYPWSDEPFERARQENKPIFLSSGAIWCHWCHVMAKECFEDEEVAKLLNENFVAIKLDRDERPEIDRRYQQAANAMRVGGGWPLSMFLTPDKKPFFSGTYFPPDDRFGRPGFKHILRAIAAMYKEKKEEIYEHSQKIIDSLNLKTTVSGDIEESLINEGLQIILSGIDQRNGGFGRAPKFPMPGAIEFFINRYFLSRDGAVGDALKKTLTSMAKGGFHDQIGGGFHRYSTDEAWIVPHFEKMADDNAWLLRNYVDAYSVFRDEYFREVAEGIITFTRDVLSDPKGGFYASQDADVTPDDEGGYFTWTDSEFKRVLNSEEYNVLSSYLLHDRGVMHHDESKRVLFVSTDMETIAQNTGMDVQTVANIIHHGKEKLLRERNGRKKPFIDRTLYTSLNGMFISAYFKAFRVFRAEGIKSFALKGLERILGSNFVNNHLFHSDGVGALLDDYVHLIDALISGYEVTGDISYLDRADRLMEACIEKFWDKEGGGFFDTEEKVIGIRLKGVEDIPHPSANSLIIMLLIKLSLITEKEIYRQYAERSLRAFSLNAQAMGVHAGYFFCAIDALFNMLKLDLHSLPTSGLTGTALSSFHPYTSIVYGDDRGFVIPCFRDMCYEPIDNPDILRDFLTSTKFPTNV